MIHDSFLYMMRRSALVLLLISLLIFWLISWGGIFAAAAEEPLLSALDIPLMPDYAEDDDSRVVFDTPEGRIIQIRVVGPIGAQKAFEFYQLVLPSLAWDQMPRKEIDTVTDGADCKKRCLMMRRGGEILKMRVLEEKTQTVIYFSVNPE